MIFNNSYDRILWLILKNDKCNREKILEFIESIPSEFLIKIQDKIREYEEYKIDNNINKKKKYFNGEFYDGYQYLYHFNIDKDSDTLFIGRNILRYGKVFNDFGLLLINNIDTREMDNFCEYVIGKISYDYELINDGIRIVQGEYKSIDYKLLDIILGNIMVISNQDRMFFKNKMNLVNVDDIPNDYNLEDINRLVRKKI